MRIITFFSILLIMSCAATTPNPTQTLFDRYTEYNLVVNKENLKEKHFLYIHESWVSEEDIDDIDVIKLLMFKNWVVTQTGHYEEIFSDHGCLTINGYNDANESLALSFRYIQNNDDWLINEMHIFYTEKTSDLPTSAKCPKELLEN